MRPDPRVLEQRIAKSCAGDAASVVGRDAELGLEGREVEEEEVARVVARNLRVDLGGLDACDGFGGEEAAEEGEAPVEGDGPALLPGIGVGVSLEDFKGDIGLGRDNLLVGKIRD